LWALDKEYINSTSGHVKYWAHYINISGKPQKILQNQILKILIERYAKFDSESNGICVFKIGRLHLEKLDFVVFFLGFPEILM
jgi:hypothetical protein